MSERREEEQDLMATLIDALGIALGYVERDQFLALPEPLMKAVGVYEEASHRRVVFLAERRARSNATPDMNTFA